MTTEDVVQKVLEAGDEWLRARRRYFEVLIAFEAAMKLRLLDEEPGCLVALKGDRVGVLPRLRLVPYEGGGQDKGGELKE